MIGTYEIIFSLLMFGLTWYAIFKFRLIHEKKKTLNKEKILKRIEEQTKEGVLIQGIKAKMNFKVPDEKEELEQ